MNRKRNLLLLILWSSFSFHLMAQTVQANDGEETLKWYQKVGGWFLGKPWNFKGEVPTHHQKHLFGYSWQGVHDSYLSPIAHSGWGGHYRLLRDYYKRPAQKIHFYDELSINGGIVKNKANGSNIYQIGVEYLLGPTWRLLHYDALTVDLGPMADVYLSGNFKPTNTNNVANAKVSIGIDAWGRVRYELPKPLLPLAISYSLQSHLVHFSFHPAFGQSYYDYVSGDNHRPLLFLLSSFHNTIFVKQRLLIDFPVRYITLTTGLEHWHLRQNINYTTYVTGGLSLFFGISYDYTTFSGTQSRSNQIGSSYYPRL